MNNVRILAVPTFLILIHFVPFGISNASAEIIDIGIKYGPFYAASPQDYLESLKSDQNSKAFSEDLALLADAHCRAYKGAHSRLATHLDEPFSVADVPTTKKTKHLDLNEIVSEILVEPSEIEGEDGKKELVGFVEFTSIQCDTDPDAVFSPGKPKKHVTFASENDYFSDNSKECLVENSSSPNPSHSSMNLTENEELLRRLVGLLREHEDQYARNAKRVASASDRSRSDHSGSNRTQSSSKNLSKTNGRSQVEHNDLEDISSLNQIGKQVDSLIAEGYNADEILVVFDVNSLTEATPKKNSLKYSELTHAKNLVQSLSRKGVSLVATSSQTNFSDTRKRLQDIKLTQEFKMNRYYTGAEKRRVMGGRNGKGTFAYLKDGNVVSVRESDSQGNYDRKAMSSQIAIDSGLKQVKRVIFVDTDQDSISKFKEDADRYSPLGKNVSQIDYIQLASSKQAHSKASKKGQKQPPKSPKNHRALPIVPS